jgi:hypothetical protein
MIDLNLLLKNQFILIEDDYVFLATFGTKYQDMVIPYAKKYPGSVIRGYAVEISECDTKNKTVKKWKKTEGKSVWLKMEE